MFCAVYSKVANSVSSEASMVCGRLGTLHFKDKQSYMIDLLPTSISWCLAQHQRPSASPCFQPVTDMICCALRASASGLVAMPASEQHMAFTHHSAPASCQQEVLYLLCCVQDILLEVCVVCPDLENKHNNTAHLLSDLAGSLNCKVLAAGVLVTFLYFKSSGCCRTLSNICNIFETQLASLSGLLTWKSIIWP